MKCAVHAPPYGPSLVLSFVRPSFAFDSGSSGFVGASCEYVEHVFGAARVPDVLNEPRLSALICRAFESHPASELFLLVGSGPTRAVERQLSQPAVGIAVGEIWYRPGSRESLSELLALRDRGAGYGEWMLGACGGPFDVPLDCDDLVRLALHQSERITWFSLYSPDSLSHVVLSRPSDRIAAELAAWAR